MTVPQPPAVSPYSPNSTDASWKAAKTGAIRDKWNTELGTALRAAKLAYDKIKFEKTTARGITQQLDNVTRLQKNGYRLAQTDPQHVVDLLEDWAQERDQLDDAATPQQALAAVKKYEQAVQAVKDWRL
jgi:hypothetical protein